MLVERLNSLLMSDCADGLKRLTIGFLLVFVTVRMPCVYTDFVIIYSVTVVDVELGSLFT